MCTSLGQDVALRQLGRAGTDQSQYEAEAREQRARLQSITEENTSLTRMALPEATFLGKTGRYECAASLCQGMLSSEAIGHHALRGCSVATAHTRMPQFHGTFPSRKRHSGRRLFRRWGPGL